MRYQKKDVSMHTSNYPMTNMLCKAIKTNNIENGDFGVVEIHEKVFQKIVDEKSPIFKLKHGHLMCPYTTFVYVVYASPSMEIDKFRFRTNTYKIVKSNHEKLIFRSILDCHAKQ